MKNLCIDNYFKNGSFKYDQVLTDFPILKEMDTCEQNPLFHAEGNVWNHTKMTLSSLVCLTEWIDLNERDKSILFFAALFHDIGKIKCTKEENGVITSKKHSVIGARMVRKLLWGVDSNIKAQWKEREEIANMVYLHMAPIHFLEKTDPLYSISAASYVLNNKLLNILAKADNLGRICKNIDDQTNAWEMINLHKMFCEENDCFEGRKSFQTDRARFRYLFEHKGHPNIDWFEKVNGRVIIMSGIQGSGKSFIIDRDYKHLPVVGSDETRIDLDMEYGEDEGVILRSVKEQCKELMREKKSFVFNATCTIKDIRSKWIRLFRDYGYEIAIHYVERPMDITLKANKSREKSVPENVIYEKFSKLDVPTLLECHYLILSV